MKKKDERIITIKRADLRKLVRGTLKMTLDAHQTIERDTIGSFLKRFDSALDNTEKAIHDETTDDP